MRKKYGHKRPRPHWLDFSGDNPMKQRPKYNPYIGRSFHIKRRAVSRTGRIKNQKLYDEIVKMCCFDKIGIFYGSGAIIVEDARK
jgi:hypothetical protein